MCEDFLCTLHRGDHVADCPCPPIEEWETTDPYSPLDPIPTSLYSQLGQNPLFWEWMMGWPIGWTGFDAPETESYLSSQRTRLSALLGE